MGVKIGKFIASSLFILNQDLTILIGLYLQINN